MMRRVMAFCFLVLLGFAGCEFKEQEPPLPTEVPLTQTTVTEVSISSTNEGESTTGSPLNDMTPSESERCLSDPPGYNAMSKVQIRLDFVAEVGISRNTTDAPTYTLINQSGGVIVTGHAVDLYELVGNEWLLYDAEIPWNTSNYAITPGSSETFDLPLSLLQLPAFGVYSLAKEYDTEDDGNFWVVSQAFFIHD